MCIRDSLKECILNNRVSKSGRHVCNGCSLFLCLFYLSLIHIYAEVISGYTAFLLGVRSVVPDAVMSVRYTNNWNDYLTAVSYTHLDVYKRQLLYNADMGRTRKIDSAHLLTVHKYYISFWRYTKLETVSLLNFLKQICFSLE